MNIVTIDPPSAPINDDITGISFAVLWDPVIPENGMEMMVVVEQILL